MQNPPLFDQKIKHNCHYMYNAIKVTIKVTIKVSIRLYTLQMFFDFLSVWSLHTILIIIIIIIKSNIY